MRELLDELFTHSDGMGESFFRDLADSGLCLPEAPLRVVTISPGMSEQPFDMNATRAFAGGCAAWMRDHLRMDGIFYYINSRIQGIVQVPDREALSALYDTLRALRGEEDNPQGPIMAISSSCTGVRDISRGCKENEDARVFGRFLSQNIGIMIQPGDFYLYYEDAKAPEALEGDDAFFGEISQRICSAIIIGDRQRMHHILDEALGYMITRVPRVSAVHMRAIHFCKPLEMSLVGSDLIDRLFVQDFRLVERVIRTESEAELRRSFHDGMDAIWDYAAERKKQNRQEIMHRIVEYIDRNLSDTELSIQTIAENFRMHPTRLSALFRDYYKETIPNMIHEKRIAYIRSELLNSSRPVREIALDAGYISIATMNRAFLKSEGIYPGQYRKKLRKDGAD